MFGYIFSDKTLTSIEGFVGIDHVRHEVVLSFRGSASILNFIADLDVHLDDCDEDLGYPGCKVHGGFLNAWQDAEPFAMTFINAALAEYPAFRLVLAGHSLGAAAATVAAAYLRKAGQPCDLYTYGSPRVGNEEFVQYMMATNGSSNFRVTHWDDPVPQVPPTSWLMGSYRHISPEYWIKPENSTTIASVSEIEVCVGTKNKSCNAGQGIGSFDRRAHTLYMGELAMCAI